MIINHIINEAELESMGYSKFVDRDKLDFKDYVHSYQKPVRNKFGITDFMVKFDIQKISDKEYKIKPYLDAYTKQGEKMRLKITSLPLNAVSLQLAIPLVEKAFHKLYDTGLFKQYVFETKLRGDEINRVLDQY